MLQLNEKFHNEKKKLIKEGKRTVASWIMLGNHVNAEVIAKSGIDWLFIDLEHGGGDIPILIRQLQAIRGYGAAPIVRATGNDPLVIKRILDAGAYGISIPYVSTGEEVEAAVKACKYPPQGFRGVSTTGRASGYGLNAMNYLERANEELLVMVAVETEEAIANLDEILAVEGLDGIFIGPMDLATSMGYFGNPTVPQVQQAIAGAEDKIKRSDKFLAGTAADFTKAKALFDRGYRFVAAMSDCSALGKAALDTAEAFKTAYPER